LAEAISPMTVTNKPDHRGERDISRKTIARGMPGDSGVTVVTMLVCSFYFACEAAGASSARHSLRPLFRERDAYNKTRAKMRREIAKLCPDVIARSNATRQSILPSLCYLWIASLTLAMTRELAV
jgi:hypothetical protein